MQADVLTTFLAGQGHKVKVFPTRKDVKPFKLDKKAMRLAFPFLLASAMLFVSCSERKSPAPADDVKNPKECVDNQKPSCWDDIYQQVVKEYNLVSLKDKVPLSLQEIKDLIKDKQVEPTDTNFNHAPENVANFWAIVKGGVAVAQSVQSNPKISDDIKKKYLDMSIASLSKISKIKGTKNEVDIKDYNNLHAFLFFEKMLKYKDNANYVLYKADGWIDEKDELFGRYYKDNLEFISKAEKCPGIDMFAKALYSNTDRLFLSAEDSVYANALSRKMFEEWKAQQNIKADHLCVYMDVNDSYSPNTVSFGRKRGMFFGISLEIDPKGQTEIGSYTPVGLIEIHEGQHILQLKPASNELPEHNQFASEKDDVGDLPRVNSYLIELGPTLYTLTYSDRIYKAIHKIDRDAEVDYGVDIQIGDSHVALGHIANWFGQMLEKYPSPSVDRVLQQPEVMQQLNNWGLGKTTSEAYLANNVASSR